MKTAKVTGLGRILIDGELVQLRLRAITGYPEPKQPIVATPAKVCEPSLQLRVLQDTRSREHLESVGNPWCGFFFLLSYFHVDRFEFLAT
jgi:hypothetical protein